MAMREDFIYVDGLATRILTCGGWIDEFPPSHHVVLCIPGNPGITQGYTSFLATLHSKVGVPVWIVSHAGLELPWDTRETLKDHLDNYNVIGQARHKIAFIKKYVPKDVKLTLIGHSVGCKMILDMLKDSQVSKQVEKCYLLFPTIERLAVTPNGKFFIEKCKPFVFLVMWISWYFQLMPMCVKMLFMRFFAYLINGYTTDNVETYVQAFRPVCIRNMLYLAFDEMDCIKELDKETIEKNSGKLVFYYGTTDKWVPLDYCRNMKETFPDVDVIECEKGFRHGFVMHQSVAVGSLIGGMIHRHVHPTSSSKTSL